MKNTRLSKFKYAAAPIALGLAMISTPSFAQDAEEADAGDDPIIVTGSRIARPDLDGNSPVTVVGAQDVAATGTTRVEDLLNSLPQVYAGQNAFISNGATGTASVNLRGIGSARTLVLINGRRLQPGDPSFPVADLNQIPAALIERVDVLTGGASATYGADAVAGVVNFVMNTDFEGIEISSQYSVYQHKNRNKEVVDEVGGTSFTIRDRLNARGFGFPDGNSVDGATWDTNITIGGALGDRGNFVGYMGYRQVEALLQGDRDHSSCSLSRSAANNRVTCGGSATAPLATIADATFGDYFFSSAVGGGVFGPYQGPYNFAPINYFQRPNKRWTAGFFADYEVNDSLEVYGEFQFMDSRTVAQIAQSGTFFNSYDVACNSPLLTAAQGAELCAAIDTPAAVADGADAVAGDGIVSLLIGKRNVEGGPRRDDLRHTAYRAVFGARGDITSNWRYDVSGQYGTTVFQETYFNDLSSSRLRRALDAVVDGSGNVVCSVNGDANTANDDAACAPYNPFNGQGIVANPRNGITQAAINYVNTPGFQRGETEEWIASGYVTGDLGALTAATPVSMVLGTEYRKVQIARSVDTAFATGDLAGQGGPQQNIKGEYSVKELFGELLVPILEDTPGFQSLSLELGYRYSDYTSIGTTNTYKILGEWQPIDAIKIRGGYNRAVRAPNVVELFAPRVIGLFGGSDPCAGTPSLTAAQCANTGVTAAQFGNIASSPADQYNQFIGGTAGLKEETADTYTAGVVLNAQDFVPGLTMTVDYFNINVKDAIGGIGAQTILNRCAATGSAALCSLVKRDPVSGSLWLGQTGGVINYNTNTGGIFTEGVDIGLTYSRELLGGRANLQFNGTWLSAFETDTGIAPVAGGDAKYDCVGFHGSVCGTPTPKWRHTARLGWTSEGGFGASVRWRYFNAVKTEGNAGDIDLGGAIDPRSDIAAQSYFDLNLTMDIADKFEWNLGVNNILDRDPPLVDARFSSNANTYAEVYDPVGRYIFVGGTLRF